ncbi:Mobile element protein [hydrothermal vent metagenome]|uniref:Mobile element protein n=1 Tax=hydrothermal vent metagenome TaxID=652676 RepID=A0A3B0RL61_9ZZZZ
MRKNTGHGAPHQRKPSRTSVTRKQYSAEEKIRIVLDAYAVRKPLPSFVVVKGLQKKSSKTNITLYPSQ